MFKKLVYFTISLFHHFTTSLSPSRHGRKSSLFLSLFLFSLSPPFPHGREKNGERDPKKVGNFDIVWLARAGLIARSQSTQAQAHLIQRGNPTMHRSNTRVGGGIWYLQSKKRYPEHSDAREVTGNFNFTNEGWKEEGDGTTGWASNRSGKQPRGGGNIRVISSRVRRAQSGRELEMVRISVKGSVSLTRENMFTESGAAVGGCAQGPRRRLCLYNPPPTCGLSIHRDSAKTAYKFNP